MSIAYRALFLRRIDEEWKNSRKAYRQEFGAKVADLYDRFFDERLADRHFAKTIAVGSDDQHQERIAELLLASQLWDWEFSLSSADQGPDFLASKDGNSAWIELISPNGRKIPWLTPTPGNPVVQALPHQEMALCYTAGVKEKYEKLVGVGGKAGYLESGVVQADETYVIALNQSRIATMPDLNGISQLPIAVEVMFSVGPLQLQVDRNSGQVVDSGHTHRASIRKSREVEVASNRFLDPGYASVAALLAIHLAPQTLITPENGEPLLRANPTALVYNPNALNPLEPRWLPAQQHWVAAESASEVLISQI